MWRTTGTLAIAGAALLASCDDPRAPKLEDRPGIEARERVRDAGPEPGAGAAGGGDGAANAGERSLPGGGQP